MTGQTSHAPDWAWVRKCAALGGSPTWELWREAVDAGAAAVPLMVDILSRRSFREGEPPECAHVPVHAMRVLGEIGSVAAIPALVNVLTDPVDPGLHGEEAALALARLGAPALAPVEGLLADAHRDRWVRVAAARTLLFAAARDRRLRPRVREAYGRVLADPRAGDRTLVAHVVANACQLGFESLLPAIEAARSAGRLDEEIIDLDSARLDLLTRHHRVDPEVKHAARRDPGQDYLPWSELTSGMDAAAREALAAELRSREDEGDPAGD